MDDKFIYIYEYDELTDSSTLLHTHDVDAIMGTSAMAQSLRVAPDGSAVFAGITGMDSSNLYSGTSMEIIARLPLTGGHTVVAQSNTAGSVGYSSTEICVSPSGNKVVTVAPSGIMMGEFTGGSWSSALASYPDLTALTGATQSESLLGADTCVFLTESRLLVGARSAKYPDFNMGASYILESSAPLTWDTAVELIGSDPGHPTITPGTHFGSAVMINPSRTKVAITATNYNGAGAIMFYDFDGVDLSFNGTYESVDSDTMALASFRWAQIRFFKDDVVVYGRNDINGFKGMITALQEGEAGVWEVAQKIFSTGPAGFGTYLAFSKNTLLVSAFNDNVDTSTSAFFAYKTPCTTSSECPTGEICTSNNFCLPYSCTSNYNCSTVILDGRLGVCTAGTCVDSYAGTCDSPSTCDSAIDRAFAEYYKIGHKKVRVQFAEDGKVKEAVGNLINYTKGNVTEGSSVIVTVSGTSEAAFDLAIIGAFSGTQTELGDHIKSVVCGTAPCEVTFPTASRRRLQSAGTFGVSVTFDVDEGLYNQLLAQNAFSDPGFAAALAAAAGVNSSDVVVTPTASTLEVTFIVAQEPTPGEPLGDPPLDLLQEIGNQADALGDVVATEVGIPTTAVAVDNVDLCADRDCSGRGTCDADTGKCDCQGQFWGINCETPVTCLNAGVPAYIETFTDAWWYCNCPYPYYGLRCGTTNTQCQTCGA
jgi:hypothetical protein